MDDFFDGWLSIPAITDFLADDKHEQCRQDSTPVAHFDRCSSMRNQPVSLTLRATTTQNASLQPGILGYCAGEQLDRTKTPTETSLATNTAKRQRRGHTKSRHGCIECKKRKIKCQEALPACSNCLRRGFVCKYPTLTKYNSFEKFFSHSQPCNRLQTFCLSGSPATYSSNDMQLFHHYITVAHPFVPRDYHDIWIKYVPSSGHQYPWVMNAMLAIAGSHLDLVSNASSRTVALHHRQKAIQGLENAFTKWPPSTDEAHVMLAASYLLSFQSAFLTDGFLDHILSLRGCATLSRLILSSDTINAFIVKGSLHDKIMEEVWDHFVHIDQELAREALASVRDLGLLMAHSNAKPIERALVVQFLHTLRPHIHSHRSSQQPIVQSVSLSERATMHRRSGENTTPHNSWQSSLDPFLSEDAETEFQSIDWDEILTPQEDISPVRSFNALMSTMTILATWPQEDIMHLFSPSNKSGQIILAHFCTIRLIMNPMTAPGDVMQMPARAIIEWTAQIIEQLLNDDGFEWDRYIKWPEKILKCMQVTVARKPGLTCMDIREMLLHDPGAFKEGREARISD